MKLEDQICSYEQAIKLKELGVAQQSIFYYVKNWLNPRKLPIYASEMIIHQGEKHQTRITGRKRGTEVEYVAAYTVAELGEMLPHIIKYDKPEENLLLIQEFRTYENLGYVTSYLEIESDEECGQTAIAFSFDTEAKSRAELLIYLFEDGIVNVDQINEKYAPKQDVKEWF